MATSHGVQQFLQHASGPKDIGQAQAPRIYLVDSKNATVGQRLLVEYACKFKGEGLPAKKLFKTLIKRRSNIRLIAILDTLEHFKKGGRISAVVVIALLAKKPEKKSKKDSE